nr:Plasmid stability protein [Klebsiella pneumoniae]
MPDGQYSFYLHSDDRTDIAAMATISTISQPCAVSSSVPPPPPGRWYTVDARLPALIRCSLPGN